MFCHLSTPRKTHLFSSDRSSVWIFCPLSQTTIPDTSNIPTSSKLPRGKSLEVKSHYVLLEQKLQFDLKCWQHDIYRNHYTNVASVFGHLYHLQWGNSKNQRFIVTKFVANHTPLIGFLRLAFGLTFSAMYILFCVYSVYILLRLLCFKLRNQTSVHHDPRALFGTFLPGKARVFKVKIDAFLFENLKFYS